jgi:putative addiction module component (TIGR02574 family)
VPGRRRRLAGELEAVIDEAKTLLEEALRLPIQQRARLVSSLINGLEESDEADAEQAWIDEVHKRARELETGQVRGLTWAEARRIMLGT